MKLDAVTLEVLRNALPAVANEMAADLQRTSYNMMIYEVRDYCTALLDTNGQIVGMVAAKLNALKVAKATGDIPENINFAIKTGMIRDFLDNSVVPYQTPEANTELKTADIAHQARAYTLLISCTATEQAEATKK